MRARNIKPNFFKNENLAEIEPLGRLLFAGLWCLADRDGKLEYRPKRIKAELLPYDDCEIGNLMGSLEQYGFITIYEIDGSQYVKISNFNKHQNPHHREAESLIPEPNGNTAPGFPGTLPELAPNLPGSSRADSLNLIPDTLNPKHDMKSVNNFFEEAWKAYPRKEGKGKISKSTKISIFKLGEEFTRAIERYTKKLEREQTQAKYVQMGSTFFNSGYIDYLDENFTEANSGPKQKSYPDTCPKCENRGRLQDGSYCDCQYGENQRKKDELFGK